jgi:hypothetical protein
VSDELLKVKGNFTREKIHGAQLSRNILLPELHKVHTMRTTKKLLLLLTVTYEKRSHF